MSTYAWLIRRELWERRSFWVLPAVLAVVGVLLSLFSDLPLPQVDTLQEQRQLGCAFLAAVSGSFFIAAQLQMSLYLLDCLYEDRRDRSILFWKSLPVSDTDTVLSKLLMGAIIVPLLSFVMADASALLIAAIATARDHTLVHAALWQGDLWLQLQVLWLYIIVTTAVWYLPVIGYMLVVSAVVKRAPLLWFVLPFLIVYLVEVIFLHANVVSHAVVSYLFGYLDVATRGDLNALTPADIANGIWPILDPVGFFTRPAVWAALVLGAVLVAAAIQIRMRRTES